MTIDQYRQHLARALQEHGLPRHMWDTIIEYIVQGRPVGEFLEAVLCNDFMKAVAKADIVNSQRLKDYAIFLYSVAPAGSFGSPSAYQEWVRLRGVIGRQQQRITAAMAEAHDAQSGEVHEE